MQRTQNRPTPTRRSYPAQFKAHVVASFLENGQTVSQVAHDFGLREATVRRWIQQAATASLSPHRVSTSPDPAPSPASHPGWGDWPIKASPDWYDADAVRWTSETGKDVAEAAYQLGIPTATLHRWLQLASQGSADAEGQAA